MNQIQQPDGHHQTRWTPPPGSSVITLLRHGATVGYYADKPFPLKDGHGDPELAPDGEEQAIRVGARLAAEHQSGATIGAIYVTTLRRTHQTAAPLVAAIGLEPIVEADLREVFLGEWEGGLFRQKMNEGHPSAVAAMQLGDWGHVPGAESNAQLTARVMGALERVAERHVDERVVCVVHGGVVGAAISGITKTGGMEFLGADNSSLSTVVRTPTGWRVRGFNDTSHLDGGWVHV